MFRFKLISVLSIIILISALSACDDDPAGSDELSEEEVELMMEAYQNAGILAGAFFPNGGTGTMSKEDSDFTAHLADFSSDFETEYNCPEDGSVVYDGTLEGSEMQFSSQLVASVNDCSSTDREENLWVFNGSLDQNVTTQVDEESFEINGSQEGAIVFDGDVASGDCEIDVSFDYSIGEQSGISGFVDGTVCGQDVSQSFDSSSISKSVE